MNGLIFDSHAHYDDKAFDPDRGELLAALPQNGVGGVVNCGASLESSRTAVALAEAYPYVYAAVGVHPEEVKGVPEDYLEQLERQAVERAMRLSEGNVTRAAEYLGITRFALYRKLEKLGL